MPAYVGDLQVRGTLKPDKFDPPASCIDSAAIEDAAGIEATKIEQQIVARYQQPDGTTVAAARTIIHQAFGANGTLKELHVTMKSKCTGGTSKVQVMIKKNGTDMLASALEHTQADANFSDILTATFVSAPYVRGDVFEVVITPVTGGGTVGQGLGVTLIAREDAE